MHSFFPASPQLLSITKPPNAGERVSRPSGRHDRVCFVCNSQQQPNICRQHPLLWGEHHGNICAILVVMFQVIMLPLEEGQALSADLPNLQNTLLEATVKGPIIQVFVGQGQVLDPTWVGNSEETALVKKMVSDQKFSRFYQTCSNSFSRCQKSPSLVLTRSSW